MSVNIIKAGRIVRTSKNLRGVLDYARVSPVRREMTAKALEAFQSPGGQMDYRKRLLRLKRP